MTRAFLLVLAALSVACGRADFQREDASVIDAGRTDASVDRRDAGPGDSDAGGLDAGLGDAGLPGTDAGLVCASGAADCDGLRTNGCEVDLTLDPAHCGDCVTSCPSGVCVGSTCTPLCVPTGETPGDGVDQDCDGFDTCYRDADGDGVGGVELLVDDDLDCANASTASTSELTGDCNDSDARCTADCSACDCTVRTVADSGAGSLRACIDAANASADLRISFEIALAPNASDGTDAWWRIALASPLPPLRGAGTLLDAATQSVASGDRNGRGPEIEILGSALGSGAGLTIEATDVEVRGVAIDGFDEHAVHVRPGASRFALYECHVGADAVGAAGAASTLTGVYVQAVDAAVGAMGAGNLVAYNDGRGVWLGAGATESRCVGNHIHDSGLSGVFSQADSVRIVGNLVRGSSLSASAFDEVVFDAGDDARLYHNTIVEAQGDGVHVGGQRLRARNNIITGGARYGFIISGGSMTDDENLVTDQTTAPANALGDVSPGTLDPSTLNADPQYRDPSSARYELTECTSPAIDYGADLGAEQPDLNGPAAGLFNGSAPDLGAFETSCP